MAASLVMMLVFAAIVVDLGAQYNSKRQDQTSADAAALAGAQHLALGAADATTTAETVARSNLPATYTDAQWNAAWAACTDPDRDTTMYPNVSATTACVSFSNGYTRIRVRIPTQIIGTSFARVIGINTLSTSAGAEAQIEPPAGGGVLPFGVVGFNSDLANQVCLTGGGGCGGSNSDTLRALDSPLVGNPQYGGFRSCRPANFAQRIEYAAAMGIDHLLVVKAAGDPTRLDDCDVEDPNTVYAQSLQGAKLTDFIDGLRLGLIAGPAAGGLYPDNKPARLRRIPSGFAGWETRTVAGVVLDNRPLWEFIPTSLTSPTIPATCTRSNFSTTDGTAVPGGKAKMQTCLADYINGGYTQPMFTRRTGTGADALYDIQLSSRLAFVPSLPNGCCPDGALGQGAIQSFNMVFLQTMYLNSSDSSLFEPGEGTSALTMSQFDGLSALRLKDSMVPASVLSSGPNGSLRGAKVSLFR
jgi:hypothetical protein